jgi:hypothetical protein
VGVWQTTSTLLPSGSGAPGLLLKDTEPAELVGAVEALGAVHAVFLWAARIRACVERITSAPTKLTGGA